MYFSKALFKQSMKANWVKWVAVTVSTCVMLAIVIIVLGNLGINDIRDSLKNVFVQADQESYLKENAVDSYDMYLLSTSFENTIITANPEGETLDNIKVAWDAVGGQYDSKIEDFKTANEGREPTEEEKTLIRKEIIDNLLPMIKSFLPSLGPSLGIDVSQIEDQMIIDLLDGFLKAYDGCGVTTEQEDFIEKAKPVIEQAYLNFIYNNAYSTSIAQENSEAMALQTAQTAQSIAQTAIGSYKEDALDESGQLKPDYVYDQKKYIEEASSITNQTMYDMTYSQMLAQGMTEEEADQYAVSVKVISNTAISTYQLWLSEGKTAEEAKAEATKSISDQIPEKVAEALSELGNMDIYGLIIGSIFYKIAGLLLPMVFVIMTANGLIAGQVDSGSMAYVLSTPTKRRTVTCTQMTYLMISLLAMFLMVTVVSVISVWIVGGNAFAINFGEILLLNLGAFLTMFAIAGYCFMCSAIFNRSKYSMSIGGGLTIFSLVCTILGLFGSEVVPSAMRISQMNFFNYLSLITFFDTTSILNGSLTYLWKFGILLAVGIITFIVGVFRFDKKDLPL